MAIPIYKVLLYFVIISRQKLSVHKRYVDSCMALWFFDHTLLQVGDSESFDTRKYFITPQIFQKPIKDFE